MKIRRLTAVLAAGTAAMLALAGCAGAGSTAGTEGAAAGDITLRVWDEQVARAYEDSIAAFEQQHEGITVTVSVVPWADYFTTLRQEVGTGGGDDVFWLNGANFDDYVDTGSILDIDATLGAGAKTAWDPSAVEQYTRNGVLYGVPQLTDGGSALYVNEELLAAAGVTAAELSSATWSPDPAKDTLLPLLQKLTIDENGNNAASPDFDPQRVATYGFNAALDLQNIQLPFIGSNGGTYQSADGAMTFTDPRTVEAYEYLVALIREHHVAPPAEATNDDGDYTRDQFLMGRIAVFESGTYNLANVHEGADFAWSVTEMPAGPAGKVTTAPAVVVAGNANSKHPEAVKALLEWLGSAEGDGYIGANGSAVPAVTGAREVYDAYWTDQGVDTSAFFTVLEGAEIMPPVTGQNFGQLMEAFQPVLKDVFLGQLEVADGLQRAQQAVDSVG